MERQKKVALLIGGRGGVGKPISLGIFGAYGTYVDIIITSRSEGQKLDEAVAELKALGMNASGMVVEATDESSVIALRDRIAHAYGRLDILVNLQGGNRGPAWIDPSIPLENLNVEAWKGVLMDNTIGVVLALKHFLPLMAKSGDPSWVVNIGSEAALRPLPGVEAYSAAKAAVHSVSKGFAKQCAARGWKIAMNTLVPGFFPADQNARLLFDPEAPDGLAPRGRDIHAHTQVGRFGTPDDLVEPARYLVTCSPFVTGTEVVVDGGFNNSSIRVFR